MKKLIVLFALLVFASTVTATMVMVQHHRLNGGRFKQLESTVELDGDFVYTPKAAPKMRTFNLNTDVTLRTRESRARVYFDFQDIKNHHYVDLTSNSVEVVVVRGDIEGEEPPVGRVLERVQDLSFPVGESFHVSVKRRRLAIRVVADDVVVAEAYDETFHGGQAGYASKPDDATFENMTVQSVADIYFADDFMRTDEEKGIWTELRGNWKVNSVTHPSMSANAFQYIARSNSETEGAVVAGYPFWDDYAFEVSVKPQRHSVFGLYFYYRDENNYFRFEWHPDKTEPQTDEEKKKKIEPRVIPGKMQLVRVWNGERTVVGERPRGFKLNQWYAIKCVVSGRLTRTYVDENLMFEHRDDRLASGMIGLYVGPSSRTFFDDVFVRSYKHFEDGFTNGGENAWSYMGGRWKRVPLGRVKTPEGEKPVDLPLTGVVSVSAHEREARAAVGSSNWKNYVLQTEIHPDATGRTGVVLYYQDETRYYQVACRGDSKDRETWTLERVLDGECVVLDERSIPRRAGSRKVTAGIDNGYISVAVTGEKVLEAFDTKLRSGSAGLFAADVASASFGPVKVDWPLRKPPLLTLNEVFEQEISMGNWSSVESEWTWDASTGLILHKGVWPGDAEIAIRLDATRDSDVGLLLSGDEQKPEHGYLLKLAPGEIDGKKQMTLQILRAEKPLGGEVLDIRTGEKQTESLLALTGDIEQLGFKRIGSTLIGYVNDQAVIAQRDAKPLKGDILGWYDKRAKSSSRSKKDVLKSLVSVSSPNVNKYLFRRAHTDWRVVRGIWEVTNRWQCDPRWTFFSGRTSWKLAAIWNKRKLHGDTTLDFYIGPKMDRDRGGRYEYVADFNCTLAANGIDLDSGYSFLFGGLKNSKTILVRKNKIVAEAKWPTSSGYKKKGQPVIIPTGGIHRQWFRVKAQKKGGRLRLWIDDALVIDYKDPDPLTGERAALWTWNNGIMVARVTVSAEKLGEYESPDAYTPSQCRCFYDEPAVAGR